MQLNGRIVLRGLTFPPCVARKIAITLSTLPKLWPDMWIFLQITCTEKARTEWRSISLSSDCLGKILLTTACRRSFLNVS